MMSAPAAAMEAQPSQFEEVSYVSNKPQWNSQPNTYIPRHPPGYPAAPQGGFPATPDYNNSLEERISLLEKDMSEMKAGQ